MSFIKTKEDFVCEHCSREVLGNGYTNHCPRCLWGKHVDKSPGDRKESCSGLMKPVGAEQSEGEWSIIHKCEKCSFVRKNKISPDDNFDEVVKMAAVNPKLG